MKMMLLSLSMLLASSFATAMPATADGLQISVSPNNAGAWVTLKQHGLPVSGATINNKFITSDLGRVYVYIDRKPSTNAKFVAITKSGDTVSTYALIPRR